jgi:CO/xanthine dehydrogenase FAD-binding subunit
MKPPPFEYLSPATLDEALGMLGEYGDRAKVLAGGQSLVPLLNFRLVRPEIIVDLNAIGTLAEIRADDGGLAIGALARQRAVERSPLVRERCPLMAEAMPLIGHFQIRNRGTVGGSLAHADPAAELPAVAVAVGAELVVRSARGERRVPAREFFVSYLTTALGPDELLTEVRIPAPPAGSASAFLEVSRRHGDFALVGVAVRLTLDGGGVATGAAVAVTGVGPTPVVADRAIETLVGQRPTPEVFEEAGRRVSEALSPDGDIHASADYRKHVAGVLTRRALARALERARGASA